MRWVLTVVGVVIVVGLAQVVYLAGVLVWEDRRTRGLEYYGQSVDRRGRFKRRLRWHARLLAPILRVLAAVTEFNFRRVGFEYRGVWGPDGTCSEESFAAAEAYRPDAADLFVVAQMKCGTTWMQHLAYQVLRRGRGDLVESGVALNAVSPWLESGKTVPVEQAPRIGEERARRLIKTHLPASMCPYDPAARYIYVVRHPVSCFASLVDFLRANAGAMAPEIDEVERWFCSEEMWWGPWPDHLLGWSDRSERRSNVLLVRFEDMKRELPGVIRRLFAFLDLEPPRPDEIAGIAEKCSFSYMREHAEVFEMHPPHVLSVDAELFVKGSLDRHTDVPPETRARILRWCRERLGDDLRRVRDLYPDLTALDGVAGAR